MSPALNRTDAELPGDVADAVRTTAAHVPPPTGNLAGIHARAHAIRRRRRALSAAAAVAVLAAGAALPALRSVTAQEDVVAGDPSGRYPIALWLDRDKPPKTRSLPAGRHVPGSSGDIAARLYTVDGKPTITPVGPQPGADRLAFGPALLPGGGLASISLPVNSPRYRVFVADADGGTVASRLLPQTDTGASRPMPMTGSTTKLFWWQTRTFHDPTRSVLLTYDIAAGTLRELAPASAPIGYESPYFGMHATAERIISWPARFDENCSADVRDAKTGERVSLLLPAITGCTDATFVLSPDNKHAAVLVTYRDADSWSQRVVIIDAVDGAIEKDFKTPPMTASDRSRLVYGIDWADEKKVRYARGILPETGRTGPAAVVLTFKL